MNMNGKEENKNQKSIECGTILYLEFDINFIGQTLHILMCYVPLDFTHNGNRFF